ncbi:hypothetical protein L1987_70939 [Smallanthus sonchifolius]|uniref:Uncharacterized protein n=1 Tax=Smallanthus sonchifolius TaxID=185202 RepID=A0ACB9AQP8_9ASTR|nr:hypothetical protein L1987_70939 [Smallanthus sonchifolius]
MAAPPNGLSSSSRRRHRSSSLRDSPDEDGGVDVQEPGRLRDRGVVKKDRDRDRDRERSSRSKRRRENRMMVHHVNTGSNRDDGDDTSEESVNDEDEEDDDDAGNGGDLRMLPPPPANTSTAAAALTSNHHNHSSHPQQLHPRNSFPPSANKVFRAAAAAPPPAWKAADEMIGVSVPRKARSASTKRSHEWNSGVSVSGGVGGTDQISRQSSTSPVRLAASPAPVAPPSPSSSNVSVRKKMKANGGGSKPRPPKSSSKSSSSNPEELEIEIAEVLYGLMTQSQAPSKKEIPSNDSAMKSSSETKSRVSSPTAIPQNSTSLSTVAPKRKRPRQVSENPFNVRSSPVSSSIKTEMDRHHHQSSKTDISSPYLENNSPASAVAAENGVSSFGFTTLPGHKGSSSPSSEPSVALPAEEMKCGVGVAVVLTKEEAEKESASVELNVRNGNADTVITTAATLTGTNLKLANPESQNLKDEKFEIDLMAPPQQRTSQGSDGEVGFSDHKQMETSKTKEDEKLRKSGKDETMKMTEAWAIQETGESSKQTLNEEMNIELNIDLEKPNKGIASRNRSLHQALKHQQLSAKSETHTEKTAQPSSMPMPMSVANWPPMGYVAPLQGVISMDGNTMASAPIQPLFTHPRPKRCATHCYIARNIHYIQQFMKNPFWPAASGSAAPMFGAKPCNLNVLPSTELHANIPQSMQDKGQAVGIFPGHTTGKDTKSSQSTTITDPAQRKQHVLLQQAMPPVTPNNILHGPAFIFPFNQQQAVAASASVRPGSSKLTTSTATGGLGAASGAANSPPVCSSTVAAAPGLSFNYPNMSANETQYLAILQNNPYSFPMPAVGAPPNYGASPHAQVMSLFNGSFYSSQMMHSSQIPQPPQQAPPPTQVQNHHPSQSQQTHQNSSGSTSSSQKQHLQAQQRLQGSGTAVDGGGSGSGGSLHNSYHAGHKSRSQQPSQQQNQHMNPALQARHLENEVTGGEDSPLTADSRVSRTANTMSVYSHNFAMPVHPQNFALMNPQAANAAAAASSANSNDKKQQQQQGLKRGGLESSIPPQTFAMSFAPMNGNTGTIPSMAQNHAIFQNVPDSLRQSYHQMMTAPAAAATSASAHHSQQKKDFRVSEEATRTAGHDSSNADDDRKLSVGLTAKSGQSIAFSRPDLASDASGSSAANNRSSRSPISTAIAAQSSHHLHAQFQQQQHQQVLQLQKQQQNARTKNQPSSNGSSYPEHLITSSSTMAAKFPNSISSFPLQTSNTGGSPVQSPQWRNSVRGPTTSQVPSSLSSAATTTSSLKNLHQFQQQSSRSHQQSHTQISFGASANQKLQSTTSLQMQQQQQNQNPSSNSGNQSPSPPMLVGSPTTSISKGAGAGAGAGGSPRTSASASTSGRTGQASSLSSSQQVKNTPVGTQRSSPSILGNPHNSNSTKSQQQLPPQQLQKQALQQQQAQAQAHMFFTHPYMQVQQPQAQQHSASSPAASGYYLPRKQQQQSLSSTAMLSQSPPVTLANTTTSDPAKAIAAATSNLKGGIGLTSQQGILHAAQYGAAAAAQSSMPAGFPQYVHNAPAAVVAAAAVQVKPVEQKQPADE